MTTIDTRPHAQVAERPSRVTLHNWVEALCMQGGLKVEGDETLEDLIEAVDFLVESNARRAA